MRITIRSYGDLVVSAAWIALLLQLSCITAIAQETADTSLPAFVSWIVDDISQQTTSTPSTASVTFSNAALNSGMSLSISVKADSPSFTPPGGSAILASKVSWTVSGAIGGTAYAGTLSDSSYTEIYRSTSNPTSGSVNLTFRLDAPGSGILAGDHNLTLRWKVESVL